MSLLLLLSHDKHIDYDIYYKRLLISGNDVHIDYASECNVIRDENVVAVVNELAFLLADFVANSEAMQLVINYKADVNICTVVALILRLFERDYVLCVFGRRAFVSS